MKDNNKVFSVGGYVTEIDWGTVERVLGVKVKATNKILRCILDGFPPLGGPLEVER